nr:N-acetylmuramidase domain-containing protein [Muribaculum gordoncarteri]
MSSPVQRQKVRLLPGRAYERLKSALSIDSIAAIEGTFWGMFQIGGFNWKKCGTESPVDFARRMSTSEKEQLELFVNS